MDIHIVDGDVWICALRWSRSMERLIRIMFYGFSVESNLWLYDKHRTPESGEALIIAYLL